jgi:hypothetical protein
MIHIFRIFTPRRCDYLEFNDRNEVINRYNANKDLNRHHWQVISTRQALKEEIRWSQKQSLEVMLKRGDQRVVKVVANGDVRWYSPSNAHGIPSEYQIAIQHFTDDCQHYKVTKCHHEVFKVIRDPRFQSLHRDIIDDLLSRVRATRCATRLDKYLDLNLRKLPQYGFQAEQLQGTYEHIKHTVAQNRLTCPLFSDFMLRLLDICIEKERELLGTNRVYEKQLQVS